MEKNEDNKKLENSNGCSRQSLRILAYNGKIRCFS